MKYRDYFSLKTLGKYNIDPNKDINILASLDETKKEILKYFNEKDKDMISKLNNSIDNAFIDMRLQSEKTIKRENIIVSEAMDDVSIDRKNISQKSDKTLEIKEDLKLWNILLSRQTLKKEKYY